MEPWEFFSTFFLGNSHNAFFEEAEHEPDHQHGVKRNQKNRFGHEPVLSTKFSPVFFFFKLA